MMVPPGQLAKGLMLVAGLLSLASGLAPRSWAQSGDAPLDEVRNGEPSNRELKYRRMYVPAERIDEWPRDVGVRYRPMPKTDFERLVELLQNSTRETGGVAVRVVAAHYSATLEDNVLRGQAELEIDRAPRIDAQSDPSRDPGSLLPLAPCGVSVEGIRWSEDDSLPATFGLDSTGRPAVLVRESGTLRFHWSLVGLRTAEGRLVFEFDLPAVVRNSLTLSLAPDIAVTSTHGAILEGESPAKAAASAGAQGEQPSRVWKVELGGHHRFTLGIARRVALSEAQRQARVRQSAIYSFSPRGLELTVQLTIDAGKEPLRQLELSLDPELRLLAVRQGEHRVPWSVVAGSKNPSKILLELPQPIAGTGNVLRLGATAPMRLAQRWRLPAVHTQGLFWQEGKATLLFPKPLVLEHLETTDCRQTSTGPLPPPTAGETVGVQFFVPEAAIEVVVDHARERLRASWATVMELAEDAIHARVTTELRLGDGQLFALSGEVPHEWTIDSVESVPPGRLKDWSLDSPSLRKRRLEIQLSHALTGSAPLRLVIGGHRLNPSLANPVGMEQLQLIEWDQSNHGVRAMSVRCPDNFRLKLSGEDPLNRLDPRQLPSEVESLFSEPAGGLTFLVNSQAAGLQIALERHAPQYSADLTIEAVATSSSLWEMSTIVCRPQNSRVERLRVHFSHARSEPPRWTLGSEGEGAVVAQRLSDDMAAKGGPEGGETWELVLRRPRTSAFEIRAVRRSPLAETAMPVSLISLPEADGQQGELSIRSIPTAPIEIKNHSLKPLSIDPRAETRGDRNSLLRASFRYVPNRDGLAVEPPALALMRSSQARNVAGAVAWSEVLESRYDPAGHAHHVATWRIQNESKASVAIQLPKGADDTAVWVDDQRLPTQIRDGKLEAMLPAGRAFPTLVVSFRTPSPDLRFITRIAAPEPEIGMPVLSSRWIVWLPPGYGVDGGASASVIDGDPFEPMQRLFGPLAQTRGEPSSLLAGGWPQRLWGAGEGTRRDQQRMRQVVEWFGAENIGDTGNTASPTWAALLEQVESQLETSQRLLLIDWQALAEAGVAPQHPLPRSEGQTAPQRGLARLQQAGLMLALHDEAVLLTTAASAAMVRSHLAPLDQAVLASVRPGALATALETAVRQRGSPQLHLPGQWVAEPAQPWEAERRQTFDPADVYGWSAYPLDLSTTRSAYVIREAPIGVLAWGLFLLIAILGRRSEGRPMLLVALTGMAMLAALLLPAMLAPLATSVVLGLLYCLAMHLLRRRRTPDRSTHSARAFTYSDNAQTMASLLLLAVFSSTSSWSHAADAVPSTVHKVFIPTDDEDNVASEHYWIPEALYAQLERSAAEASLAPRGWLLENAEYRAEGNWDVAQQKLLIPEIKCRFDLQVFDAGSHVVLPLGPLANGVATPLQTEAHLLVDGRQVTAQWTDAGRSLAFDVADAGRYRVEIALAVSASHANGISALDLAIPPLPTSRLELHLPRTAPNVDIPTARGPIEALEEGQRLVAHLGGASRLSLRWRDGAGGRSLRPIVEADQLLWLHVQPGSVTADVKVKFRVLEGSVRQLQLALDPRWQLQPSDELQPLVAQVRTLAGSPQLLQFELARPVSDQITIAATLRLTGASSVGNLRIPYLEPLEVRFSRQLLAVSIDTALEYLESGAEMLLAAPPAEFLAQWATVGPAPQLVYRVPSEAPNWSLAVRPTPVKKSADTVLAVSVSPERAALRFEAAVETSGPTFQYRVAAPPDLEIESIVVLDDEVDRLARWSRDSQGRLTLFLSELANGPQQVVIKGSLPLPKRGPWKLPVVRVDDAEFRSGQIRIYRQPLQTVTVRSRSGLIELPEQKRAIENLNPELDKKYAGLGHIASLLKAEGANYAATLEISPNRPKFAAAQTTLVRREGNQWQAEVDCRISVESGIVDLLRFNIPDSWQGPFQVIPPATTTLSDAAGDGTRQLLLRPYAPVTGEYHLKLRGDIAPSASGPLLAPAISLVGAQRLTQTLVLPTQLELQPIRWETQGLVRTEPPHRAEAPVALNGTIAYQVVDDAFSAELQPAARPAGQPQVYLADVLLACQAQGTIQGVASFDLDPAGNGHCPLLLPRGYELLQVSVNGAPATVSKQSANAWRIGLGSDQLPQRIEVVFGGQLDPGQVAQRQWKLTSPRLGELDVLHSLWTVHTPPGWQLLGASQPQSTTLLRQGLARLTAIASLTNLAPAITPNKPVDDVTAWYAPWARRFVAALSDVRRELLRTRDNEAGRLIDSELRDIEQDQAEIARKLAMPETLLEVQPSDASAEQSRQIWQSVMDRRPATIRLASADAAPQIVLVRHAAQTANWLRRAMWSLAVALAAVMAIAIMNSRHWERLLVWRHTAGVALGLAWWLWLSPPVLGWLIVAASLLAALANRRRPRREMGSSVIRLSTSSHG